MYCKMKEKITLNEDEQQVLLYVRAYPGITQNMFKDKHLDAYMSIEVKETLSALKRKGFIDEDTDKWYCIKEIELPC